MKISFVTSAGNFNTAVGYGVAGYGIVRSLGATGHDVRIDWPEADVEIAFCQPDGSSWSNPDAYHIQYTPWESTELRDGWLEAFNDDAVDEVWTTSPWCKSVYESSGIIKPIYVYEHGIDPWWKPTRRVQNGPLKVLHVGEPATRKGGQLAYEAFKTVFGDRGDATLTIKAHFMSTIREYGRGGSIIGKPQDVMRNVKTIYNEMTERELIDLYLNHDVLVYPSAGEGFGFIPLQGIATGLPVITTYDWAPYERFIIDDLKIESTQIKSPWQFEHPGLIYDPNYASIVKALETVANDYDKYAGRAYKNAFKVHEEYNWENQTNRVWNALEERLKNR